MQSTIVYDAGSAEFTVLNRCYVEISGLIYFIRDTLETANLTIDLYLNGAYLQRMYTGISDERILMSYQKSFEENDVLKFMVTCPDDITIETDDAEHYITIKKIAQ